VGKWSLNFVVEPAGEGFELNGLQRADIVSGYDTPYSRVWCHPMCPHPTLNCVDRNESPPELDPQLLSRLCRTLNRGRGIKYQPPELWGQLRPLRPLKPQLCARSVGVH